MNATAPAKSEAKWRRQEKIYNPTEHNLPVSIVGCGSLGGYIAYGLAKLGVTEFVLYDEDTVEEHNISNQPFTPDHVGKLKVSKLNDIILKINPKAKVGCNSTHWNLKTPLETPVIFSAADDIDVRKLVAMHAPQNAFIVDVRSGTEIFDIYFARKGTNKGWEFYNQFFFDKKDVAEENCNLQTLGYSSMVIAGLAVDGYIRYARGDKFPAKVSGLLSQFDFETVWL